MGAAEGAGQDREPHELGEAGNVRLLIKRKRKEREEEKKGQQIKSPDKIAHFLLFKHRMSANRGTLFIKERKKKKKLR